MVLDTVGSTGMLAGWVTEIGWQSDSRLKSGMLSGMVGGTAVPVATGKVVGCMAGWQAL